MKSLTTFLLLGMVLLFTLGCEERTDQTDTGGVLLELDFVLFPFRVSVNNPVSADGEPIFDAVTVETMNIISIVSDPDGTTSALMDVELDTMEVVFARADAGTRVPPPFVLNIIGRVPVGGTLTLNDLPILSIDQFRNPPLSDLFFENGGFDKETGSTVIKLNATVRFYGRTLTGDDVATVPRTTTLEFVQ